MEWSDVTPLEFPTTNSFLYVNQDSAHTFLYLMYDFPARLSRLGAGESVHVTFNTVSQDTGVPQLEQYDIDIFSNAPIQVRDQGQLIDPGRIAGAAGFGPSPNSATPHVMAELQVPLTPGAPTAYSPDPLFWSATLPPTPPPDPCPTDQGKKFNRCVKHDLNVSLLVTGLLIAALGLAAAECTAATVGGCAPAEIWMLRAVAALAAVAAGLGYEIGEDPPGLDFTVPPDPNFTVIAQPVVHTLSITTAGLTPDEVAATNAFTANVQQLVALQQAQVTALARAAGARLAGNTFWENNQSQAALTFGGQAAPLISALPGLLSNIGSAIKASGVSFTFTAADAAKFQTAIDPNAPASEPQQELAEAEQLIAQQLGISSAEQALFTPLIRSVDPQQVATLGNGAFPAALSDPVFAQAFQALGTDQARNAPSPKSLNPSFHFTLNGDYVANGVGLRGGTAPGFGPPLTSGNISISGIPTGATVARAFLYWGLLDNGLNPAASHVTLNGTPVNGSLLGSGPDTCWGRTNSFTFRAEVTPLVTGNGTYTLSGIPTGPALLPEGASLVVIYQAAGLPTKTVILADGNVSIPSGVSTSTTSFSGFSTAGPVAATTTFMVGDGQLQQFGPTNVSFTGSLGTLNIPGLFAANNGPLWDTDTANVSSVVGTGGSSSSATIQVTGDCVLWSAQAFAVTSTPVTTPVTQTAAVVEANLNGDTVINQRGLAPSDAPTLTDRIVSIVQFRTIQNPSLAGPTLTNQLLSGLVSDGVISTGDASSIQSTVLQTLVPPSGSRPPGSLRLDGTTGYAEAAHASDLNITGDWTVETWFKDEDPNGFNHDYREILMKGDRNANPEAPYFLLVGNNNIIAGVRTGGVDYPISWNLAYLGLDPKAWHHVAVSFNSSFNVLNLWLDGQHIAYLVVPTHSSLGNALPLEIGRGGPTTGKYWLGKLEDLRIWNVARKGTDITANYKTQLSGAQAGLVANWHFDDGSGTFAADTAGNHHQATLNGGATFSTDIHP